MVPTAPIDVDGKIIGALGVTLDLEDFGNLLDAKLRFPSGISFYAHKGTGEIAVHPNNALILEPFAASAVSLIPGTQVTDTFSWTFVLGTPESSSFGCEPER